MGITRRPALACAWDELHASRSCKAGLTLPQPHASVCLGVEETLASPDLRKPRRSLETPGAIASHAEPADVKADLREEVEVGRGGQPKGRP